MSPILRRNIQAIYNMVDFIIWTCINTEPMCLANADLVIIIFCQVVF